MIDHPTARKSSESDSIAKLCEVCSKLNVQHLTHPLLPCHNPLPCSTPPIDGYLGLYIALGSVAEVNSRRFTCDICKLVAESLDNEPPELSGECRIRESAQFCNFNLPKHVKARDPSISHFHLTQVFVIFDTSMANQFHGPALPWEVNKRDNFASHYILNFQVRIDWIKPIVMMLMNQMKTKARSQFPITRDQTAVSSQTEQAFLETIGGRYVGTQVKAELIRSWLHDCECKHDKVCMPSLRDPVAQNNAPTFVVDVVQWCLVNTPYPCRYVALSYVWGTAAVFKHLLDNTQKLRKMNSLRSLPIPATIRDAITLVHAIGERYLWVDSICIIQDDLKMQQAEVMRMGSIYSKALFTIIAAAGDHANTGLSGIEQGSRKQVQKSLKLANCELLTVIDIHHAPCGIDGTTWAQRAWTFQERVLSNRVLVFSENQVYWSCRAASHSEERALEEVEDIDQLHLAFPQKYPGDCLSWKPLQPLEYCYLYDDLLYSYRQRHLTYQSDILNAFNGVTEMLAGIQGDTFFWGLPESFFSYAITWSFMGRCSRNFIKVPVFETNGTKKMVPIPSWSWAAWDGKESIHLPDLDDGQGNIVRPIIQFNIVDNKHQLISIKERPWQDHSGNRAPVVPAVWQPEDAQPHQLQFAPPHILPQMGQLHFWTSFANVRSIRSWILGGKDLDYTLFPSPDVQLDPSAVTRDHSEIVHQDFIVVAVRGAKLILLAIEWKDGIAYRVGKTTVKETEWIQVKNRQWRLIMLG